ncbi:MAG: hypothetical protein ABIL09_30270 [Gemmatimonadota bacterium]
MQVLAQADSAVGSGSGSALLQYARGQALARLGRARDAAAAFGAARDQDPQPWRATAALNRAIRETAVAEHALLADVEAEFERHSAAEGVGWDLMADHLHPTTAGQLLLARTVVEALESAPPPVRVSAEGRARLRTDEAYRQLQGDFPTEEVAVTAAMADLFGRPPLGQTNGDRGIELARQVEVLFAALSPPEQLGATRWRQNQSLGPLVVSVADQLFAAGELARAAEHYRAARLEEPYTVWSDLWATARRGRCQELLQGRLDLAQQGEVRQARERALLMAAAPDTDPAFLDFFEGYAAHLLGDRPRALEKLQRCAAEHLDIQQHFTFDLLALLSEELVRAGRRDEAERYVREVSARVGKPEVGRSILRQLRARSGPG